MLRKHNVEALRWTEFADRVLLEFKMPEGSFAIGVSFGMGDAATEAQRARQVWRALHWHIKAKLDAVDFGLEDMVRAFMPYMITGPNRTLGDDVMDRVADRTLGAEIPLLPEGR
jgi:hypothetical protein